MIDQIFKLLIENDIPGDVVDATMDTLIIGLMNKLSPEEKKQLKREMEQIREEFNIAEA